MTVEQRKNNIDFAQMLIEVAKQMLTTVPPNTPLTWEGLLDGLEKYIPAEEMEIKKLREDWKSR